jgi:hypothetical protein
MSYPVIDSVEVLVRQWRAVEAERLMLVLYSRARVVRDMFGLRAFADGVEVEGRHEACFPGQWAAESWAIQRFPDFRSRGRRDGDGVRVVCVWQLDPAWLGWHRERRERRQAAASASKL